MRAPILFIIASCLATARADACPVDFDPTTFAGGGPVVQEVRQADWRRFRQVTRVLPSRPSLYVHLGEYEHRIPAFWRSDGTPVPFAVVVVGLPGYPFRIDFDVDAGDLATDGERFIIDPKLKLATRYARTQKPHESVWVEIDSDAALFRFEYSDGAVEIVPNWGSPFEMPVRDTSFHVIAMYSDRTEEVVLEHVNARRTSLPWGACALLALLGLLGRRWRAGTQLIGL